MEENWKYIVEVLGPQTENKTHQMPKNPLKKFQIARVNVWVSA